MTGGSNTRVVIAGGTGMIGRALVASRLDDGREVSVLTRGSGRTRRRVADGVPLVTWNPDDAGSAVEALRGAAAVVNLCGVPIGPLPWTPARRRAIVESRVGSTGALVKAIGLLPPAERPRVLVNASGTDAYTGIDAEPATETARTGHGFLADLGTDWEGAAREAEPLGVRVVMIRTGFVLARESALLRLLALPSRLGIGGPIGSGDQWFSWIHIDDLVAAYRTAIADDRLSGPVNATSPEPCRQRDVAATLGRVLHRPSFFRTPAWLVRLAMRDQSTLILGSRRVVPARLLEIGVPFAFANLDAALRDVLGRRRT